MTSRKEQTMGAVMTGAALFSIWRKVHTGKQGVCNERMLTHCRRPKWSWDASPLESSLLLPSPPIPLRRTSSSTSTWPLSTEVSFLRKNVGGCNIFSPQCFKGRLHCTPSGESVQRLNVSQTAVHLSPTTLSPPSDPPEPFDFQRGKKANKLR